MLNITEEDDFKIIKSTSVKEKILFFDPGLHNVAVCRTNISKIHGDLGKLYYRGQSIEQLADADFLSIAYLLIYDKQDSEYSLNKFKENIFTYAKLLPEIKKMLDELELLKLHPMNVLSMCINYISAFEDKYLQVKDLNHQICFIISQMMVISSYYATKILHLNWKQDTEEHLNFAEIMVNQISSATKTGLSTDMLVELMNLVLVLHAEHGQNCSTATVRNIASTKADPYQAVIGGIAAFKGDLHGGASQRVSEEYQSILSKELTPGEFVSESVKNKKRIMGFGHRVYKAWDPRAAIMYTKLDKLSIKNSSIATHKKLAFALIDEVSSRAYFKGRRIFPNPDLLNGIIFSMIGVPSNMNTVMLCISRIVGWLAHYREHVCQDLPLVRPRQLSQ
jgi:citrate synthase